MKYYILSYLFIYIVSHSQYSFSQGIVESQNLKRGVYRTFEEFKLNIPAITEDFNLMPQKHGRYTIQLSGISYTEEELQNFWGFCTGDTVYVNTGLYQKKMGYVPILELGRYSILVDKIKLNRKNNGLNNGSLLGVGMLTFGNINDQTALVLNVNNGNFYYLNKAAAKTILESDSELFREFKKSNKKNSLKVLIDYIKRYNQRNRKELKPQEEYSTRLLIYRKYKKESDTPIEIIINNEMIGLLYKNQYLEKKIEDPINFDLCLGITCTKLTLPNEKIHYLEYSQQEGELGIGKLVPEKEGKFYIKQISAINNHKTKENE